MYALLLLALILDTTALGQDEVDDSLERDYRDELPRIPATEPQDALATFEVHPDFRIELVAAEPLVHDPVAMAFDERGRLFVVEMRGYSERRDEHIGAVRLLTDANGDGIFDQSSVYVEGLAWPTAVACYDGGVFVGVAPDIIYCKDTDGDGRADTRKTVFTGFGLDNVQGLLNSFNWGIDNRIHGATSGSGGSIVRADYPGSVPISVDGRDFSFDPRWLEFRPESGGGQHGLSFDLYGRKFVCHNSDHIMLVMYDDRYLAPWINPLPPRISIAADGPQAEVFRISPVEPWREVRTRLRVKGLVPGPIEGGGTASGYFTSATGITVYKGDAWPDEYRGHVFIGDVGGNLIHRKILEPDGVKLIARRADAGREFVASRDIWFRPVQFCNGPDGALYVADMYREVIEHPDSLPPIIKRHLDLNSGHDRGRIYRIVPRDFEQPVIPDLGALASEELVPLLSHPNAWHHETAQRLIYERQSDDVEAELRELLERTGSPIGQIRALHLLDSLDALAAGDVQRGLESDAPQVRSHAVHMADRFMEIGTEPYHQVLPAALKIIFEEPDPFVRYQLAFSLRSFPSHIIHSGLGDLALKHPIDDWTIFAIVNSSGDSCESILNMLLTTPGFVDKQHAIWLLEGLAQATGKTAPPSSWSDLRFGLDLVGAFHPEVSQRVAKALLHGLRHNPDIDRARDYLNELPNVRQFFQRYLRSARNTVLDPEAPLKRRIESIEFVALDSSVQSQRTLSMLIATDQPDELRAAALSAFASFDNKEVAPAILAAYHDFPPDLQAHAIELLLERDERIEALLDATEEGEFPAEHINSLQREILRRTENSEIQRRAVEVFGRASSPDLEAVLARYRPSLDMEGDPEAGEAIFHERCAQCHRIRGLGHEVAPDLAGMLNRGPETLLTSIIDPNREIDPRFVVYVIETGDDETISGLIETRTATSITFNQPMGRSQTVLRSRIREMWSPELSLMPEGLEQGLTTADMADLIAFILNPE